LSFRLPGAANDVVKTPLHWLFQRYYGTRARLRTRSGVSQVPHDPPVYVTLTSIPKRFGTLHLCVESLLSQSFKPDRILLWIAQPVDSVPPSLKRLQRLGLEILVREDVGPLTKLVHAIREFPDAILVSADDDNIYPDWWLRALVDAYGEMPEVIHCHRATGIVLTRDGEVAHYEEWNYGAVGLGSEPNMLVVPTGVSGVLYPPGSLHQDVLDIQKYRALSPLNDDFWLKTMSMLKGTCSRLIGGRSRDFYIIPTTQKQALWHTNELGANEPQVRALLKHYQLTDYFRDDRHMGRARR
jgi:hypothetical protein